MVHTITFQDKPTSKHTPKQVSSIQDKLISKHPKGQVSSTPKNAMDIDQGNASVHSRSSSKKLPATKVNAPAEVPIGVFLPTGQLTDQSIDELQPIDMTISELQLTNRPRPSRRLQWDQEASPTREAYADVLHRLDFVQHARVFESQTLFKTETELVETRTEVVTLQKEKLDLQARIVSLEEAKVIGDFEEAKANADFLWKSIYALTDLIGPTVCIYCVMLNDTMQWCLTAVLPSETSMEFFQNHARYHIGWFLGAFRNFIPPWMNHLIDSTDSRDLRSKRNIGFICISLYLYAVFKFVQSFVTCKGTVNDVVESWTHNFSLKNVTQFSHHEYVSMQKTELCWDACMWLSVITIGICTFHNNSRLHGYVALAFWGVWTFAYIVHELLLVFAHDEVDCPLFFNVDASNATQAVMRLQPYEIVLRMN